jgi:hypothetical protein
MVTVLTALLTASIALLGYWLTYQNNIRLARRVERLERINRQLGEFYGPLLAIVSVGQRIFQAHQIRPRRERVKPPDITDPEVRAWMKAVFMPNNERLYELVLTKAHLLVDRQMPDCLLQLCAHVAAYRAIMNLPEDVGNTAEISPIPFPQDDLISYARERFLLLRREQARLMKALGEDPEELPGANNDKSFR